MLEKHYETFQDVDDGIKAPSMEWVKLRVKDFLKERNLAFGELVRLKKKDEIFEGHVVPVEDPEISYLVLKLGNGYNIGFHIDSITEIETLTGKKNFESFPVLKQLDNKNLPPISIIATGGTIASRIDYHTGGVHMLMDPQEFLFQAPQLANIIELRNCVTPFRVASEDMGISEIQETAILVAKELNEGSKGVVVTHGTDTLHYTSAGLSYMLKSLNSPVACVGAQRSPDRGSFDGSMNLVCGAHFCISKIAEVAIVMHGEISDSFCLVLRGTKVRKMHTSRRDAFKPINVDPLAKIWPNGRIKTIASDIKKIDSELQEEVIADTKFETKVAMFKVYPSSDPNILEYYVDRNYRGFLIEATGLGHVPTQTRSRELSWISAIERAIEEGITVAMAPQCLFGRLQPFVYSNARILHKLGVIFLEDILPESGYLKLGWVLGHTSDPIEIRKLLLTPIAGDISPRLTLTHYS